MTWMLDTNALRDILRGEPGIVDRFRALPPSAFVVSPISITELRFGIHRRDPHGRLHASLADLLSGLHIEPLTADAADLAGRLMGDRSKQGRPLHLADALIASQALIGKHVLVTRDRDFTDIPELVLDDWL